MVNSVNPYRIEGQKSGAFEIVDQLGDAPDVHCIPVGNAGNITAYWKGYLEFKEAGRSTRLPRMLGFQAAGAAPIVAGHPIEHPDTVATAIRIGNPASWYGATSAASESGGGIAAVTDDEILEAYRFLAAEESVFCEPASAASVAGLLTHGLPDGLGAGVHRRLRAHRARAEGPGHRHQPDQRADRRRRRPGCRPPRAVPLTCRCPPRRHRGRRGVVAARARGPCMLDSTFASAVRPFGPAGGTSWFDALDQPVSGVGGSCIRDPSRESHLPTPLFPWLWGPTHPPTRTC